MGTPVVFLDPLSKGAEAYKAFAWEFMAKNPTRFAAPVPPPPPPAPAAEPPPAPVPDAAMEPVAEDAASSSLASIPQG